MTLWHKETFIFQYQIKRKSVLTRHQRPCGIRLGGISQEIWAMISILDMRLKIAIFRCVSFAMFHSSKTWSQAPLCSGSAAMTVPWSVRSVAPKTKNTTSFTTTKLGIVDVMAVLRNRRLKWYGHVQRATSFIKYFTGLPILSTRGRGRH